MVTIHNLTENKDKKLPKPDWIRVKAPQSEGYKSTHELMRRLKLNTVCEEAACPNIGECWTKKHATVMILGSVCTRACAFCNVKTGRPDLLDPHEPDHLAEAVGKLGLEHVVITSVDRDDLPDGGAEHFARCITKIRQSSPKTTIEVLTPDFLKKDGAPAIVVKARPDVYNHNVETVPRLYKTIRPGARYFNSLHLLKTVKELAACPPLEGGRLSASDSEARSGGGKTVFDTPPDSRLRQGSGGQALRPVRRSLGEAGSSAPPQGGGYSPIFTKSGLMVGLGEEKDEVLQVMDDMRSAEVDFITIGQYLQPTPAHAPVDRYVTPDEFDYYARMARAKGFLMVSASPLTRSSYHAGEDFEQMRTAREAKLMRS